MVPVGDAGGMAGRLVELLSDTGHARAMGRRGRAAAERELSLDRKQAAYADLYCRVLDRALAPLPGEQDRT